MVLCFPEIKPGSMPLHSASASAILFVQSCFDESLASHLCSRIQLLLDCVPDQSGIPMFEISLLMPEERTRMLKEWQPAPADYPGMNSTFGQLLSDHATYHPEDVAIEWQTTTAPGSISQLTYAQMLMAVKKIAASLSIFGCAIFKRVCLLITA